MRARIFGSEGVSRVTDCSSLLSSSTFGLSQRQFFFFVHKQTYRKEIICSCITQNKLHNGKIPQQKREKQNTCVSAVFFTITKAYLSLINHWHLIIFFGLWLFELHCLHLNRQNLLTLWLFDFQLTSSLSYVYSLNFTSILSYEVMIPF